MLQKLMVLFPIILLCLVITACQTEVSKEKVADTEVPVVEEKKEIPSVCIWDKASIRAEPSRKAKWISAMALGEKVTWLGEASFDSTDKNREYLLLRLSDGTEGWASEYAIAVEATPAAIINKASIYRRPDLLTITDYEFLPMELIAVLKTNNEWIEVTGKENKKKGWIQSKFISSKDENVAVALLAMKAFAEKDETKKKEKIEFILDNTQFANSIFKGELEKKLQELTKEELVVEEADSLNSLE